MAAKRSAKKQDPFVTRAQLLSLTRFGPEASALEELMLQAHERRDSAIQAARSSSRGATALIDQSRPQAQAIYSEAGLRPGMGTVAPALPQGIVDFASAGQFEQAAAQHRLAQQATQTLAGLAQQRASAAQAEPYAVDAARRSYEQDVQQIGRRATSLADQQGAFTASTALDLADQAAQAAAKAHEGALNRGNARLLKGVDGNGQPLPGRGPKPKVKAESERSFKLKQQIIDARAHYERLLNTVHPDGPRKGKRWTPAEISEDARANGVADVVLSAAKDLSIAGYVSAQHASDLQQSGVRLPKAWKPTPANQRARQRKVANTGAKALSDLANRLGA